MSAWAVEIVLHHAEYRNTKQKRHESNIQQILTNEKYIGDALLQKTYTVSVLDKKRSINNGQRPKYYVEGSHEAIISKDVFMRVQSEIARRANLNPDGKRRVYSSKYALSGMVFCGHCGDIYRRVKWNNRGCKSTVWRCVSRVLKGKMDFDCPARTVKEELRAVIAGKSLHKSKGGSRQAPEQKQFHLLIDIQLKMWKENRLAMRSGQRNTIEKKLPGQYAF